jgi:MFS family permease
MYIGDAIRSFGAALFSVFAPVYLFTLFVDAMFANPAAWVFVYYGAYWAIGLAIMYQALKVYPRLGFRTISIISAFATAAHAVFLILAETKGVGMLVPAVLTGALHSGLFWPAYHLIFARAARDGHRGSAVGTRSALMKVTHLLAPAIGGLVIVYFGFVYVLVTLLVLELLAVIPYSMVDMRSGHRGGLKPLLREFTTPEGKKTGIGFFGWGIALPLASFAWPLMLFLLGITYEQLGVLVTAASMITVVTLYFFGKFSDGHDRTTIVQHSSLIYAGSWVLRLLSGGLFSAFAADTLANMSGGIAAIPIDSQAYDRLEGEKPNEQVHLIMLREIAINVGKVTGALIVIGLLLLDVPLRLVLGVGIPAALLMPLAITWGSVTNSGKH